MLTEEQRNRVWSCYDNDGMLTPHVDTWEGAVPFGCLRERLQEKALFWLASNVYPVPPYNDWGRESSARPRAKASAACITSQELGSLLHHQTGILLTDAQVQEALLLVGIEPLDGSGTDWVYKVYRSSPCACVALDGTTSVGNYSLKKVDRSLRVAAVTITPLCSSDEQGNDDERADDAESV